MTLNAIVVPAQLWREEVETDKCVMTEKARVAVESWNSGIRNYATYSMKVVFDFLVERRLSLQRTCMIRPLLSNIRHAKQLCTLHGVRRVSRSRAAMGDATKKKKFANGLNNGAHKHQEYI